MDGINDIWELVCGLLLILIGGCCIEWCIFGIFDFFVVILSSCEFYFIMICFLIFL